MYAFNRITYGVKVAPGILQQIMDTMLSGLDFACVYLDDILIKSETKFWPYTKSLQMNWRFLDSD